MDPQICNEDVQEQAAKALLILGSRYAYTGTPESEKWILKEAGYNESLEIGFHGRYYVVEGSKQMVQTNIHTSTGFSIFFLWIYILELII